MHQMTPIDAEEERFTRRSEPQWQKNHGLTRMDTDWVEPPRYAKKETAD